MPYSAVQDDCHPDPEQSEGEGARTPFPRHDPGSKDNLGFGPLPIRFAQGQGDIRCSSPFTVHCSLFTVLCPHVHRTHPAHEQLVAHIGKALSLHAAGELRRRGEHTGGLW